MRCGLCDMSYVGSQIGVRAFDVFPCWPCANPNPITSFQLSSLETPEETSHPDNVHTHERTSCMRVWAVFGPTRTLHKRASPHSLCHAHTRVERDGCGLELCCVSGRVHARRLFVRLRWC